MQKSPVLSWLCYNERKYSTGNARGINKTVKLSRVIRNLTLIAVVVGLFVVTPVAAVTYGGGGVQGRQLPELSERVLQNSAYYFRHQQQQLVK